MKARMEAFLGRPPAGADPITIRWVMEQARRECLSRECLRAWGMEGIEQNVDENQAEGGVTLTTNVVAPIPLEMDRIPTAVPAPELMDQDQKDQNESPLLLARQLASGMRIPRYPLPTTPAEVESLWNIYLSTMDTSEFDVSKGLKLVELAWILKEACHKWMGNVEMSRRHQEHLGE
jgi:hypothetical protein